MGKNIKFYLSQAGTQEEIYTGNEKLQALEREVAERALGEARASFLQEFGVTPALNLEFRWAKVSSKYVNGVRPVYRIRAADARTTVILKRNPGWLGKFAQDAKL